MKFTYIVAGFAIVGLAAGSSVFAQTTPTSATPSTSTASSARQAAGSMSQSPVQQPATVVEAQPAAESKAEALRRERQAMEIQTEQKIVEKLEDSRLQEEKARADRLFGNKLDPQSQSQSQTNSNQQSGAVIAPVPAQGANAAAATSATTPPPTSPAPQAAPATQPVQATQVTIEKLEIVQPVVDPNKPAGQGQNAAAQGAVSQQQAAPAPAPAPVQPAPTTQQQATPVEVVDEDKVPEATPEHSEEESTKHKYYITGGLGTLSYQASNVKTNYGLGIGVGMMLTDHWALELGYLYSTSNISDGYDSYVYQTMNQSDFSLTGKYFFMTDSKFRPFIGASVSYIDRSFNDAYSGYGGYYQNYYYPTSDSTNAVDLGLLAGADYALTESFSIGASAAYNFNAFNTNNGSNNYNYNGYYGYYYDNATPIEKIAFWTFLVSAKFTF